MISDITVIIIIIIMFLLIFMAAGYRLGQGVEVRVPVGSRIFTS
jgi:hypothetical protein